MFTFLVTKERTGKKHYASGQSRQTDVKIHTYII